MNPGTKSSTLTRHQLGIRAAQMGGILHVVVPLVVLIVPVLGECIGTSCTRYPYPNTGNAVGYIILGLMIILGCIAFMTVRAKSIERRMVKISLGLIVAMSVGVIYISGWSIGLAFIPVTFLLLLGLLWI